MPKDTSKWGNPQPQYSPVAEVEYTVGVCKMKSCRSYGDLGNGFCVACWDKKGIKIDA